MKSFNPVLIGLLVVCFLSIFSMLLVDPTDFTLERITNGSTASSFLGGLIVFTLVGLIGFLVFKRSFRAFCTTATIVAVLSSYQGFKERTQNTDVNDRSTQQPAKAKEHTTQEERQLGRALDKYGLDVVMESVVEEYHKELPIKMNALDNVVSITYMSTIDKILFKHIVPEDWETLILQLSKPVHTEGQTALERLEDFGVLSSCTSSTMLQLMENGLVISHVYHDFSGTEIHSFEFDKTRC